KVGGIFFRSAQLRQAVANLVASLFSDCPVEQLLAAHAARERQHEDAVEWCAELVAHRAINAPFSLAARPRRRLWRRAALSRRTGTRRWLSRAFWRSRRRGTALTWRCGRWLTGRAC